MNYKIRFNLKNSKHEGVNLKGYWKITHISDQAMIDLHDKLLKILDYSNIHLINESYKSHKYALYIDPAYLSCESLALNLNNCQLINDRKIADRIYSSYQDNTTVNKIACAYIEFSDLSITDLRYTNLTILNDNSYQIKYNPAIKPYWYLLKDSNINLDDTVYKSVLLLDRQIYAKVIKI